MGFRNTPVLQSQFAVAMAEHVAAKQRRRPQSGATDAQGTGPDCAMGIYSAPELAFEINANRGVGEYIGHTITRDPKSAIGKPSSHAHKAPGSARQSRQLSNNSHNPSTSSSPGLLPDGGVLELDFGPNTEDWVLFPGVPLTYNTTRAPRLPPSSQTFTDVRHNTDDLVMFDSQPENGCDIDAFFLTDGQNNQQAATQAEQSPCDTDRPATVATPRLPSQDAIALRRGRGRPKGSTCKEPYGSRRPDGVRGTHTRALAKDAKGEKQS